MHVPLSSQAALDARRMMTDRADRRSALAIGTALVGSVVIGLLEIGWRSGLERGTVFIRPFIGGRRSGSGASR